MPPKGRKRAVPLPDLTPDQLDTARNLYLRRGATPKWVAEQLGVSWRSVESAIQTLGWALDRRERDELRRSRAKPDAAAQVALEAEQDERHAALARRELDLREALVEKAHAALVDMTPEQALRSLSRFSGLKDLQFVERLARNRSTDKTDSTTAAALVDLLMEAGAEVETEAEWEAGAPTSSPAPSQAPSQPGHKSSAPGA